MIMSDEYLKEEWRDLDVEGCGERYSISSYGRVYDKLNVCYVSQVLTGKPKYFYVNLLPKTSDGVTIGKRLLRRVHNLMGKVFLPNDNSKFTIVDHKDQNKYNNSLDNLRWVDRKGNSRNTKSNNKLLSGELVRDICEEMGWSYSNLFYIKNNNKLSTWEEALSFYENKITYDKKVDQIKMELGIDSKTIYHFLDEGYSLQDIRDKKLTTPLYTKDFSYSIEVLGRWFPSMICLCNHYNINFYTLIQRLDRGEPLEEALFGDRSIESVVQYKGKGYTYKQLEELATVNATILRDRVEKKGWSVEEAVELNKQREKYFIVNGVQMTKKAFVDSLNLGVTSKSFNSRQKKAGLTMVEALTNIHDVDLSEYTIELKY